MMQSLITSTDIDSSIVHLLHRARQCVDALVDHECQRTVFGLTSRQLIVLVALEANEQSNQTQLVELTGMDRSTLSDLMRRLQRRGWIRRRRSNRDRRAYKIEITETGNAVLATGKRVAAAANERLLEAIPPNRRQLLPELLEKMIERLSNSQA